MLDVFAMTNNLLSMGRLSGVFILTERDSLTLSEGDRTLCIMQDQGSFRYLVNIGDKTRRGHVNSKRACDMVLTYAAEPDLLVDLIESWEAE